MTQPSDIKSLTDYEHMRQRPDMYIGSKEKVIGPMYIFDIENSKIRLEKKYSYSNSLYKMFDEILVNATDHRSRTSSVTAIDVTLDLDNNVITICNNGMGIPIAKRESGKYIIEELFTKPRTGSNFNDTQKRFSGGRNGYGCKIVAVFSSHLNIDCATSGKRYTQDISNGASIIGLPTIKEYSGPDYTKISFSPDQSFLTGATIKESYELLARRILDTAIMFPGLKVTFNGADIPIKTFEDYTSMVYPKTVRFATERFRLAVFPTDQGKAVRLAFVNGAESLGTHVDAVIHHLREIILKLLPRQLTSISARKMITSRRITDMISIVFVTFIENPTWDSQKKQEMNLNVKDILKEFLASITEEAIAQTELIKDFAAAFEKKMAKVLMKDTKKTDGKKIKNIGRIEHYAKANKAGGPESHDCTLFITEGDSASGNVIEARKVFGASGSDYYGVFGLGGKPINPRSNSDLMVAKSLVLEKLKKIIGLKSLSFRPEDLRYGKIIILSDADDDGTHIQGLLINIFDYFWRELLRAGVYVKKFRTPCVRAVTQDNKIKEFYSLQQFKQWSEPIKEAKYCKGLGSNKYSDFEDMFRKFDDNIVTMKYDTKAAENILLAFGPDVIPRKQWLSQYDPNKPIEYTKQEITYSEFIDDQLKTYSIRSIARAMPSICDGLKPVQRQIMYSFLKHNSKKDIKCLLAIAQIIQDTEYHHGDQSLYEALVHMAHDFTGSNNINLLMPVGSFGTRRWGGSDYAASRYTSTRLNNPIVGAIFHKDDFGILEHVYEENKKVEPVYYVTTIPLILINGAKGIGTGYSTTVPKYDPVQIIDYIKTFILTGKKDRMKLIQPYYKGYTGTIQTNGDRLIFNSVYIRDGLTVRVTEIPPMITYEQYISHLELLIEKQIIESWDHNTLNARDLNLSKNSGSLFVIRLSQKYAAGILDVTVTNEINDKQEKKKVIRVTDRAKPIPLTVEQFTRDLRLSTSIRTSNMNLFDRDNKIRCYASVYDIIDDFIDIRMSYYVKRKEYLLAQIKVAMSKLESMLAFVIAVVSEKLEIRNKKKETIVAALSTGHPDIIKIEGNYDYLLNMRVHSLTEEKIAELKAKIAQEKEKYSALEKKTAQNLWSADLEQLVSAYDKL